MCIKKTAVNTSTQQQQQFIDFYNAHLEKIYRFAFYKTNQNTTIAEDITAEVFLKAYQAYQSNTAIKLSSPWIFRICQNHLVDYYRSFKNKFSESLDETRTEAIGEQTSTHFVQEIERKDSIRILLDALKFLTPAQKDVIILRYINDYSVAETAQVLAITEGAVRVRVHDALKRLKSYVNNKRITTTCLN